MNLYQILFLAVSGFFILLLIILSEHGYGLDQIKLRKTGQGQHGSAKFASPSEIRKAYHSINYQPDAWRAGESLPASPGIIVGVKSNGLHNIALCDTGDIHCLMIGAAGIGKTAYFLYPNIEYALACGVSFLSTDTKGDIFRNYASIAKDYYHYQVAVIDLRNPTHSGGFNLLNLVNRYMDKYKVNHDDLASKARAEKYAKIIAKTIIYSGIENNSNYGQNQFFYDGAEGVITSLILILAEYGKPEQRHIISVYKLIQDLFTVGDNHETEFHKLVMLLPENHKARWFAGAALNSPDQSTRAILSTALTRLNAFLDSELEQILCFDTDIDAEQFCSEKSALFIVLPEEDNTKYFLVSLIIQQLYREILSIADEQGGKLKNKCIFFLDEFGTLPPIQSAEMMWSASRSRNLDLVAIVQSLAQLKKNYGEQGASIIQDNCQLTIFGGLAPTSLDAISLSKDLGSQTVMTGSVSKNHPHNSETLSMTERALLTPDELKALGKGKFVVMKTGYDPIITSLWLYEKWGIHFDEPYTVPKRRINKVEYADESQIKAAITGNNVFTNQRKENFKSGLKHLKEGIVYDYKQDPKN